MNKSKILVLSIALLLGFQILLGQPETSEIDIAGLKEAVTIRRDARSIPYIEAKNDSDAYLAQGYVTASDRLWQMDLLRRVARGETAEIFGKPALANDIRWRKFGFAKISEDSLQFLEPELQSALQSYAAGVNAYIATLDKTSLPVEFQILGYQPRPWTPADTIVVGKILADALSNTYEDDLLREAMKGMDATKLAALDNQITPFDVILYGKDVKVKKKAAALKSISPDNKADLIAFAEAGKRLRKESLQSVGLYAEELAASNNWVISGKRTADGKPLLANDPHLQASAPGIWYFTHISTPTLRVSGVTFPGVPGIVLGHNQDIAWGATNVGPDVQDLYEEIFDQNGKYKTANGLMEPSIRKETIKVKGAKDEVLEVIETNHGPIVAEVGGKRYSLQWTAFNPRNSDFGAFSKLNRAKDWNDFTSALSTYGGATQNFVYADTSGNIGWYAAGKIPTRRNGDGSLPFKGDSSDGDWTGLIPFAQLPHLYNPPSGFIVTANQRLVGTDYKYQQISRDASSPWRARRIFDLLNANNKVTMNDVNDIQHDSFNIPLMNLAKELLAEDALSSEATDILKSWDGRMLPESKGALLVNELRNCAANKLADDNTGVPAYLIRERVLGDAVSTKSKLWLPKKFASYQEMFKVCEAEAYAGFTKLFGADRDAWVWGSSFKSNFPHPLARVPFVGAQFVTESISIAGSGQTPNVGSSVSMRHITSPGNWDATRHIIPLGQSGNPKSPFFKDQFDTWLNGTPAIFPFSEKAITAATKSIQIAKPN